jgi:hypothetical protein
MGTEEDDLLRLKAISDLPGELPNDAHRHVGPAIRTSGPRRNGGLAVAYAGIVQQGYTGCKAEQEITERTARRFSLCGLCLLLFKIRMFGCGRRPRCALRAFAVFCRFRLRGVSGQPG